MRNAYQPTQPALIEKLVAALSYFTMGGFGFIWLLIAIFTKNQLRPFLKYHIFQSIFISILFFLIGQFLGLIINILSLIPILGGLFIRFGFYLNMPLIGHFSVIEMVGTFVMFYLIITSFLGQFSYVPWVSDIIRANVRNS